MAFKLRYEYLAGYGTVHSSGILGIPRTVLRAASTAVAECSCTGRTLATGSPQLDNKVSKPYCLFHN